MIDPNEYSELIVMIMTVIACHYWHKLRSRCEIHEIERVVRIKK